MDMNHRLRGTVVETESNDYGDGSLDPSYKILFDQDSPAFGVPPLLDQAETRACRWFAWEFVHELSLLELLAEAAA